MSRIEKQLQKILGESVETETPQSRIENLIQQIIDQGGGGGGGSGGGVFKVTITYVTEEFSTIFTCNKTYKEITDAYNSGKVVIGEMREGDDSAWQIEITPLTGFGYDESLETPYKVSFGFHLSCATENDYPSYEDIIQ